jgi:hypothetical protein
MRVFVCQKQRMLRALHGRWPYRRSHCRHDLHWLARIPASPRPCGATREHLRSYLPAPSRRPNAG